MQVGVIGGATPYGLPLNETTMAQHLQTLGYRRHIVGKVDLTLSATNVSHALLHLISVTVFSFTHPPALSALLQVISASKFLTVGSHDFSVFSPSTWNDFPLPLRQKPSLDSFTSNLKTFLFRKLYTCHVFHSMLMSSSVFSPVSNLCLLLVLSCV